MVLRDLGHSRKLYAANVKGHTHHFMVLRDLRHSRKLYAANVKGHTHHFMVLRDLGHSRKLYAANVKGHTHPSIWVLAIVIITPGLKTLTDNPFLPP
jgi:hypothetical protein